MSEVTLLLDGTRFGPLARGRLLPEGYITHKKPTPPRTLQ